VRSARAGASFWLCAIAAALAIVAVSPGMAAASPRWAGLTMTASPGVAAVDAAATITGRLKDSRGRQLRGKYLTLQASRDGIHWSRVLRRKTNSDGLVRTTVKPARGTWYRFVFTRTRSYKSATSTSKRVKAFAGLDTVSILNAFVAAGIPVANAQHLNASNDPEKSLGTPGQAIGMASWDDTRCAAGGGRVEVFGTMAAFVKRRTQYRSLQGNPAAGGYYLYSSRNAIVRLWLGLTPDEAGAYRSALASVDASMP
jgi:hypothetical protein